MFAWRSQETAYQLDKKIKEPQSLGRPNQRNKFSSDEELPEHFYNDKGEVDLRNVKGEEAVRYFASQGFPIPRINKRG